ncbi:helix-turn-helix domain-containing protein [Kocuria rosea]|jgi:DNA invertase Pin-like site-specific DNA recombinase|uniref:helix-turn-helix domain-containing protein n=1 Tax=Kocuria rosea TaxID=1275 RepID=UPI0035B45920
MTGRSPGRRHGGSVFTESSIRNALRLIDAGEPATQVARNLAMSRATLYRRIRERPSATTI